MIKKETVTACTGSVQGGMHGMQASDLDDLSGRVWDGAEGVQVLGLGCPVLLGPAGHRPWHFSHSAAQISEPHAKH
jgi:hypothetical protein